jgi:acetyltransferase-like isoleucine patch superfamily enzyme
VSRQVSIGLDPKRPLVGEQTMKKKNFFRKGFNRILHLAARFGPGAMTLRPFWHKLRGVDIKGRVFIGEDVYLENEYPEMVEIHDDVSIAIRTVVLAHFQGKGRVIIEEKAFIGTGCIITAGPNQTLTIGRGSVLAAGCVVTKDVPPHTLVGGVPAKPLATVTEPMTVDTDYEDFQKGLRPLQDQGGEQD